MPLLAGAGGVRPRRGECTEEVWKLELLVGCSYGLEGGECENPSRPRELSGAILERCEPGSKTGAGTTCLLAPRSGGRVGRDEGGDEGGDESILDYKTLNACTDGRNKNH